MKSQNYGALILNRTLYKIHYNEKYIKIERLKTREVFYGKRRLFI